MLIRDVLNEAALVAARRNKSIIDASDIDEAEDRVIAGLLRKIRQFHKKNVNWLPTMRLDIPLLA